MKEHEWDKLLKIKTSGRDDSNSDTYRYPYEPTPYGVLERLANEGLISKNNMLLDYGCGKGRVSLFMSYQTKCKAIGIEYDSRIYESAKKNLDDGVVRGRVSFENIDAKEYELIDSIDRIFFFNPFSSEILESVLDNILDSFYEQPREILMFFYYPSDEYIATLMSKDWISFYDEIDCMDLYSNGDDRERIMIFCID